MQEFHARRRKDCVCTGFLPPFPSLSLSISLSPSSSAFYLSPPLFSPHLTDHKKQLKEAESMTVQNVNPHKVKGDHNSKYSHGLIENKVLAF